MTCPICICFINCKYAMCAKTLALTMSIKQFLVVFYIECQWCYIYFGQWCYMSNVSGVTHTTLRYIPTSNALNYFKNDYNNCLA